MPKRAQKHACHEDDDDVLLIYCFNIVEKTLEVTPEVVWIENHYHSGSVPNDDDDVDDHRQNFLSDRLRSSSNKKEDDSSSDDDEEEGHGLEEDGEWTLLPDGTKQVRAIDKH